ncbi:MAG: family 43 glycosylhydrolase [bacterium]
MNNRTYCNPLALPDYPRGKYCRDKENKTYGWLNNGARRDFRETADPSVLYYENKWYLYPSAGMVWVSEDFCSWEHIQMNLEDVGYAPTIMLHQDAFYLTASDREHPCLYRADTPLGPWINCGAIVDEQGRTPPAFWDPMYFSDDDGSVYLYWGCGGAGIYGMQMDPAAPQKAVTAPEILFSYNPAHVWERYGCHNEDPSRSWVEGPWMFKHGHTYYLTYCAPATQLSSYAMGVYVSDHPMGPFRYAEHNPFLRDPHGLVQGPGHGCLVKGPSHTIWAFYTCLVCYHHIFERRIGMDPVGFDGDGQLVCFGASEWPQWAPGMKADPLREGDTGWLPLCARKITRVSSEAEGHVSSYAVDGSMRTWWQAGREDREPWLQVDLGAPFKVQALRICWVEPGLDYEHGVLPGPFQYKVLIQSSLDGAWVLLLDRTGNKDDLLIDYQELAPTEVRAVKLCMVGWPPGMGLGVIDFQLFGTGVTGAAG